MEEYVSFHKVLDLLQQFQENNERLNSFGYGNLVDFGKNVSGTTVVYPFLFVVPLSIQYDENTTTYQLSCIFADRLNEDLLNEKDCVSDMSLCARDLLSQIKRGDLFDYFETILPAQAQPFMERFNDNVAGVALDLNIQIFEDINACVQYPTPTPSVTPNQVTPTNTPTQTNTPSVTPTNTSTPTNTPTNTGTPTNTPTPSSTATIVNPATLGALWWVDFTDSSTLTVGFANQITQALDKISNVPFTAPSGGPIYGLWYGGISGGVQTNAAQLKNASGVYSNVDEYTWWGTVYDDVVSQRGGKIFIGAQDPGWPGGQAFGLMLDTAGSAPYWRFQNRTNTGVIQLNQDITYSGWTAIAMRSYNSGSDVNFEVWENGSIIASGTSPSSSCYVSTNPIYSLMFDGGIDYCTEQFFFDRKLTDSEMSQVMTYLGNKY